MRFLCLFLWVFPVLAGTTGNIKGLVKDEKGLPVGGVTVAATSPALLGEQVSMTDETGLFIVSNLPPGIYMLKAIFAEAISERHNIEVYIDKTVHADMVILLEQAKGEVYQITEKATHVDVASSTVGVTVTKDYIDNVPTGRDRNFSNAMAALPTASKDAYGESVGGATSPENVYVVDGMNANDPSTNLSGTRLVLEFVDEFDVKEGGYGPELGRATGGVVNAATKSGGNDFHGSLFTYYRPGFLQASPKQVDKMADSLIRRNKLDYYLNLGVELGGSIVKDKLWFHIGYSPEFQKDYWMRDIRVIQGDSSSMPSLDDFGQFIWGPVVYNDQFSGFSQTHQYTLKLSHAIDDNNRHSLAVRGAPTFFDGAVGTFFDPSAFDSTSNGDPATFQFKDWGGNLVTGIYTYAGKYFNNKLKLDALLGAYHQQIYWYPTKSDIDQSRTTYMSSNLSLGDLWEGGLAACDGLFADNKTPKCMARNYAKGGLGSFNSSQLTRFSERVMLTNLYDFSGLHQLKYGIDLEQLRGGGTHGYTGRAIYQINDTQITQTQNQVRGFPGAATYIPNLAQTLNWAAFIGDSWNPTSHLTFNYGIRWEAQEFYGVVKPELDFKMLALDRKFSILDNWAPRSGVIWDFLGNGKGAIRFNYGRYYESVPMTINQRAFGGEGTIVRIWNKSCSPKDGIENCTRTPADSEQILGGQDSIVAPGLKGQYSDEFILSADYEPFSSWVFGIAGIYRYLGDIIEDMSTDGGTTYMFGNPGSFNVNSLERLRKQINYTSDSAKRARLEQTISTLARINEFPKPIRDIWQIQFRIDKKLSDQFMFLATYVISWAYGNYPGLMTANNLQLDPNLSTQFDLSQLVANRSGYLPQDQRHRIKLSGFYRASLRDFWLQLPFSFVGGISAGIQSGTPYEVLGADRVYQQDEIFILPRGSGGRMPWTWGIDMNLGVTYEINKEMTSELFVTFYNITNNQGATMVDDTYTYDNVRPIVGGDNSQLKHARNIDGNAIKKNPNYGRGLAFQSPFSTQFGFRLRF